MKPKLTLIGAGPGDPDLITWKGIKALQRARVILYDALVNDDLLAYTQQDSLKIFVGKRGGKPSVSQERINQLIVSYALVYGEVVRLKGGDPFIFGRGYEEINFAVKSGLETEVVPGISSATGLTALKNISLTQRGISDGVWILTATRAGNELNPELELAARSSSTVVILMGVKKLPQIVEFYKQNGRDQLPVMIIQNGSTENEKIVQGTIETIEEIARNEKIGSPAIIVIGEVLESLESNLNLPAINAYLN